MKRRRKVTPTMGEHLKVTSEQLFNGADKLQLHYNGAWYELRQVRSGGLQLVRAPLGECPVSNMPSLQQPEQPEKSVRPTGLFGKIWLPK